MQSSYAKAILEITRDKGLLQAKDLDAAGIPRIVLTRLVRAGKLQRLGRGLYGLPDRSITENESLIHVAHRVPQGVFCLLTALRFHDLGTQAPHEVWIALPNKIQTPKLDYPPLRTVRFSGPALAEGIESHTIDSVTLKIYNIPKTVADCFKFRNKIGLDVTLEALRETLQDRRTSVDELWCYARICRVSNIMRPYLEALS